MELFADLARFGGRFLCWTLRQTLSRRHIVFLAIFLLLDGHFPGTAKMAALQGELPGAILITEFQFDPPGLDKEREWIELANLGDEPLELAGYGLGDEELPGEGEGMVRFPAGSAIGAGDVIVVAQTAVGFRALFGVNPDYEIVDSDSAVADMIIDAQWASGQIALANDGDEIILIDEQDNLLDSLNYGDKYAYFTPSIPLPAAGQSIERLPAKCDTDSAVDWQPQHFPTPGTVLLQGTCNEAPETAAANTVTYRAIGEIQGPGDTSPLINQIVTFRGIVTGAREDQNAAGVIYYTLFVQDSPGLEDSDSATSDGIAVFLGRQPPTFQPGDLVTVTGQVTEYFGLTEIDDTGLSIVPEGTLQTLPAPVVLDIPLDPAAATDYLESLEGMLVTTGEMLPVVGPAHAGCGFALGPTPDSKRPIRSSGQEAITPQVLVLSRSDVECSDLPSVKSGDRVSGAGGPLTFLFDHYNIVQQDNGQLSAEFAPLSNPAVLSAAADGTMRVATMNLDNFLTPASASGAVENEIRRRKLTYSIGLTLGCPELIGVQEVETELLMRELAGEAAGLCGFTYEVTHLDSADSRGIDVALFSDPRRIKIRSAQLRQTCSAISTGIYDRTIQCPGEEDPLFSRPPLEVALLADGERLTVIVNHFKSKREGEEETTTRRLAQAAHVNSLVRERLAGDPQSAVIVLGDFNDYVLSDAWQRLVEGGVLIDATERVPAEERYSYIFDGISQLVDGILVSPGLAHRVKEAAIVHVNADYPAAFALDESQAALPFHASDHDPVLVTLSYPSHSTAAGKPPVSATAVPDKPTAIVTARAVSTPAVAVQPTVQPVSTTIGREQGRSTGQLLFVTAGVLIASVAVLLFVRRQLS